jgi:hypothetical protein
VPATRYEILLPLKYNDGGSVEPEKLLQTKQDLVQKFGALTVDPYPVQGFWTYQGTSYQDALLRYIVDVEEDTAAVQVFFGEFKEILKARFRQLDVWVVAYPIRVV